MAGPTRRRRIALLVVVAAGGGLVVAGAGATARGKRQTIPAPVQIQAVFDSAGNPSLIANSGGSTPSWTICPPAPGSACHPVPRTKHAILNPGREPAGTTFVATVRLGGRTYTARVTWHGQVRAVAPPRVVGPTRFGARVTVAAGVWTGGWGDEFDQLGLEACRTPSGTGCVVLSGGQYGCPVSPRTPPWAAGCPACTCSRSTCGWRATGRAPALAMPTQGRSGRGRSARSRRAHPLPGR